MAVRIQLRRDTATNWTTNNPILAEGELGLETTSGRWKVGNGINAWTTLPYSNSIFSGPSVITDSSAGTAFRITQTGTGNALLVEDSANPDSTPFVISATGNVGIGKTTPIALLDVEGNSRFTGQITSTVATGAAPFVVASTTEVTNLNSDLLDGQQGSFYLNAGNLNNGTVLAARMPALTGDITTTVGTVSTTLANSGVTAGTYNNSASQVRPFTVDAKGRVTSIGTAVNIAIAQSAVTSLTTDLGLKATDTLVVHLAGTETISGAKTFSSALTVQAIVTANNYDIGLTTLASDSIALNFSGETGLSTRSAAGAITFTATNYRAGAIKTVRIVSGAALRSLTFPASWVFVGTKPTSIAASKTGILTVTSFGITEADCVAAWTVQP